MKKYLVLLLLVGLSNFIFSQAGKFRVSDKVKQKFAKIFPGAKNVNWAPFMDMTDGSFMKDGKIFSALFVGDSLFQTRKEIDISKLTNEIKEKIKSQYPGYKINRAANVDRPLERNFYAVELVSKQKRMTLMFDWNGTEIPVAEQAK